MGHGFHSNLMNYQKIFVGEGLGDRVSRGLQTLKYLQYDFFSSAAHAVSNVPARANVLSTHDGRMAQAPFGTQTWQSEIPIIRLYAVICFDIKWTNHEMVDFPLPCLIDCQE